MADLPPREATRIVAHVPVAVFNADGELFAIDDTCAHQDASLSEGWLEDCMIECPLHAASFDLRTGKPTGRPAKRPVRTYPVLVQDGVVCVDAPARKAIADTGGDHLQLDPARGEHASVKTPTKAPSAGAPSRNRRSTRLSAPRRRPPARRPTSGRSFCSFETIIDSIRTRLLTLPGDTTVRTGHGDSTSISAELPHLEEWIARGH